MRVRRGQEVGAPVLLEIVAALLDLVIKLAPDEDLHAQLDAAAARRAQAVKAAADDLAFGPKP